MKTIVTSNPATPEFAGFVSGVAAEGMPAHVRLIASGRNTVAVASTPGGELNVKKFHRPAWINSLVYTLLRESKALRSFNYAMRLTALGIDTPQPVACVECRRGSRLTDSYYISRQITADEFRYVERRPDEDALLRALGHEMARLHDAGVWMRDFSPGNILFNADPAAPHGYRFHYVDLNRSTFGVTDRRRLITMFKSVVEFPEQVRKIASAYAEAAGLDEGATVAEALKVHARFQNYLRRKRSIKKALMPWRKSR